jgi:MYXO-CTERM domain-containing protein
MGCLVILLIWLTSLASADAVLTGDYFRIYYNSNGTWHNSSSAGFQVGNGDGTYYDATYPGSPWQQMSVEFDHSGSSYEYSGNYSGGSHSWTSVSETNSSDGSLNLITHVMDMGPLRITKDEIWEDGDKVVNMIYRVENTSPASVTDFRLMHAFDADTDVTRYGTYDTLNDVHSDGQYVEAVGPTSGWTVSYGNCDDIKQDVGITGWDTDADASFRDDDGESRDDTIHWRHRETTVEGLSLIEFRGLIAFDTTATDARAQYDANKDDLCATIVCDADGDGYDNFECDGEDCDDENSDIFPGADEYCDGIDNDCNSFVDDEYAIDATVYFLDIDMDGYGDSGAIAISCSLPDGHVIIDGDCDDNNSEVNPSATEVCNGIDDNCDGEADEVSATDVSTWYADSDGDGYGRSSDSTVACDAPSGYIADSTDCNDSNGAINPGATEVCNGTDDDCNGETDEDSAADASTWYRDNDRDGYGNPSASTVSCDPGSEWVLDSADCDDTDFEVNPGSTEYCNGIDDDCNGETDEDSAADASTWYRDSDRDGYGNPTLPYDACVMPMWHVADDSDCDDSNSDVNPAATEVCNGTDDDCNGETDEDSAADASTWYADIDADGYGDATTSSVSCEAASGYIADDTDCDDSSGAVNPGATEYCNDIDDNCDGFTDEDSAADADTWYADSDTDGYGDASSTAVSCSTPTGYIADDQDCDDTDDAVHPSATEMCNGIDDNCDGDVDEDDSADSVTWYVDDDMDGFGEESIAITACSPGDGWALVYGDCDDDDAEVNPDMDEVCNGIDDDCDSIVDGETAMDSVIYYADADGDGYGDTSTETRDCRLPSGHVEVDADCDDTDAMVYPGAEEVCDGIDNDCDGSTDDESATDTSTWFADADGDGFGDPSSPMSACDEPSGYSTDASDCDDMDASVNPDAEEVWYDGMDGDCDGWSDFDADMDGFDSAAEADDGDDCDDEDPEINLDAEDVWGDGIDSDCDGTDAAFGDTGMYDTGMYDTGSPDDTGASTGDDTGESTGDADGDDTGSSTPGDDTGSTTGSSDSDDTGMDTTGGPGLSDSLPGKGCSCTASPSTPTPWALFLLGLVGLRRRKN